MTFHDRDIKKAEREEGLAEGLKQGIQQGLEKGAQQQAIENAKIMIADKMPADKVSLYSGLCIEKVMELQTELNLKEK